MVQNIFLNTPIIITNSELVYVNIKLTLTFLIDFCSEPFTYKCRLLSERIMIR